MVWNGSLWSLAYEFGCYLVLGFLALIGLLSKRAVVLCLFLAFWTAEIIIGSVPALGARFIILIWPTQTTIIKLAPIFLAGACLYLYRDKVPDSGWLCLAVSAVLVGSLWVPLGHGQSWWAITSGDMAAPLLPTL